MYLQTYRTATGNMRGSRGGGGGWGAGTPRELAKLNIPGITGKKKIIFFLRLDTPWKNFLDPRLGN